MAHFELTLLRHCQRKAAKHNGSITQNVLTEKYKIPEWLRLETTTDKNLSG